MTSRKLRNYYQEELKSFQSITHKVEKQPFAVLTSEELISNREHYNLHSSSATLKDWRDRLSTPYVNCIRNMILQYEILPSDKTTAQGNRIMSSLAKMFLKDKKATPESEIMTLIHSNFENPIFVTALPLWKNPSQQNYPYVFLVGGFLAGSINRVVFDVFQIDPIIKYRLDDGGVFMQLFQTWLYNESGIKDPDNTKPQWKKLIKMIGSRKNEGEHSRPEDRTQNAPQMLTMKDFVQHFQYNPQVYQRSRSSDSLQRVSLFDFSNIFFGKQPQNLNCCLIHAINQYLGVPYFKNIKQFVSIQWLSNKKHSFKEQLKSFIEKGTSLIENQRLYITDAESIGCFQVIPNGTYNGMAPIDPITEKSTTIFKVINSLPGDRYLVVADFIDQNMNPTSQHAFVISRPDSKGSWILFDSTNTQALIISRSSKTNTEKKIDIDLDLKLAKKIVFYEHCITPAEFLPDNLIYFIDYHDRCMKFGLDTSNNITSLKYKPPRFDHKVTQDEYHKRLHKQQNRAQRTRRQAFQEKQQTRSKTVDSQGNRVPTLSSKVYTESLLQENKQDRVHSGKTWSDHSMKGSPKPKGEHFIGPISGTIETPDGNNPNQWQDQRSLEELKHDREQCIERLKTKEIDTKEIPTQDILDIYSQLQKGSILQDSELTKDEHLYYNDLVYYLAIHSIAYHEDADEKHFLDENNNASIDLLIPYSDITLAKYILNRPNGEHLLQSDEEVQSNADECTPNEQTSESNEDEEQKEDKRLTQLAPEFDNFKFKELDEIAKGQRNSSPEWSRKSTRFYFTYVFVPGLDLEPLRNASQDNNIDDWSAIEELLAAGGRNEQEEADKGGEHSTSSSQAISTTQDKRLMNEIQSKRGRQKKRESSISITSNLGNLQLGSSNSMRTDSKPRQKSKTPDSSIKPKEEQKMLPNSRKNIKPQQETTTHQAQEYQNAPTSAQNMTLGFLPFGNLALQMQQYAMNNQVAFGQAFPPQVPQTWQTKTSYPISAFHPQYNQMMMMMMQDPNYNPLTGQIIQQAQQQEDSQPQHLPRGTPTMSIQKDMHMQPSQSHIANSQGNNWDGYYPEMDAYGRIKDSKNKLQFPTPEQIVEITLQGFKFTFTQCANMKKANDALKTKNKLPVLLEPSSEELAISTSIQTSMLLSATLQSDQFQQQQLLGQQQQLIQHTSNSKQQKKVKLPTQTIPNITNVVKPKQQLFNSQMKKVDNLEKQAQKIMKDFPNVNRLAIKAEDLEQIDQNLSQHEKQQKKKKKHRKNSAPLQTLNNKRRKLSDGKGKLVLRKAVNVEEDQSAEKEVDQAMHKEDQDKSISPVLLKKNEHQSDKKPVIKKLNSKDTKKEKKKKDDQE